MAGDYTRMTFKSRKDYSGVLMQQGRVTLDADWNELVEALDHRLRAEIVDTLGRCVYSRETPDAFQIAAAGGSLTIGPGRAYIHGLLVENHGAEPLEYDPVMGELRGTAPIDFDKQPYFPNAPAVPPTGTYVAYLDVWQREVTYLEDADLVEKAIAVDTAARVQNAWKVGLLEADTGTTCDSDLPGWDALTAPSAGRLTTAAVGVPASTDPCMIPPFGGYRGTDNRLYRVEIHDGGPLGTATFKWSRDDASIGSNVTAMDASRTVLTLVRLGRDGVQRITVDDWVEVTDDWHELNGLHGELRKVAAVDEVAETITLDTALTATAFDATDPTRHTRVVRWDEHGAAVDAAGGVIQVPAGGPASPIVLEDGVQISFDVDPVGGDFHVGDYWVFAARTVDASVELLVDEPPRGVEHHFCRLAVVTFPDGASDCRKPPPADDGDHGCDCTVCVTPESHATGTLTIQKAVDMVRIPGGKVCLQPGFYRLQESVRIVGARSVHLEGKGWTTIVIGPPRASAFVVERSIGVIIDLITVLTSTLARKGAVPAGIAIALRNTIGTVIERCVLVQLGLVRGDPPGQPPGDGGDQPPGGDPCPPDNLRAAASRGSIADFSGLFGPAGAGAPLIALDGLVIETLIDENVLVGTTGIGTLWGNLWTGLTSMQAMDVGLDTSPRSSAAESAAQGRGYLLTFDLAIDDNLFVCWLTGISLEGFSLQLSTTRISGNSLLVCLRAAVVTTGIAELGHVDIDGNQILGLGFGIVFGTDDTHVVGNHVGRLIGLGATQREGSIVGLSSALDSGSEIAARYLRLFGGDAIVLAPSIRPSGIDRAQVRGNRVLGVVGNGVAVRTNVNSALIADNTVQSVGGAGVLMDEKAVATTLDVSRNQLLDIGLLQDERTEIAVGILLLQTRDARVAGNTIERVGLVSPGALARLGVAVGGCQSIRVTDNTVVDLGPPDEFVGFSAGIIVLDRFQRADVLDNSVRRADTVPDRRLSEWFGILIGGLGKFQPVKATVSANVGDRLFTFQGAAGRLVELPKSDGSLGVRGNLVEAYGDAPAVLVETEVPCVFGENRCFLAARENVPVATLVVSAVVAGNNYLDGPRKTPALDLQVAGPFTVLGNICSSEISLNGAALPAPWQQLNVP
jgi:Family of unknown function (DUF6519)/Right handed beta helix region